MNIVRKTNMTQQITNELGARIVDGRYKPGGGLPSEAELSEEFDASRNVTREAVKILSAKGLLTSRPRHGIRVTPETQWNMFDPDVLVWILGSKPSIDLLKEFTQIRLAIEPEAAALAAVAPNKVQNCQIIEAALERMKLAEQGLDDPLESDVDFHASILAASENRFMMQLRSFTETALRVSIRYTNQLKGVTVGNVADHQKIYKAIKKNQPNAARSATKAILVEVLALIDKAI